MVPAAALPGDGEMRGMLLVLLCVFHSSASCGIQQAALLDIPDPEEQLVRKMEFPWVVSLQDSQYTHLAFGCILSQFWILSIASAFQNRKDIVVIVGLGNMDPSRIAHAEYPINTIIIHEDFNNQSMNNNIALLKTDSEIHFNSLVQSVCFLRRELHMLPVSQNCWVSGWNPTSATGKHMTMSILRKIFVKDTDLCPLPRLKNMGCGRHTKEETKSVCLGEPGSPMMCQLEKVNLWVLRGILTHGGEKCPGLFLYTKVEEYSNWIIYETRMAGLPLPSRHHWEKLISLSHHRSHAAKTQSTPAGLDYLRRSQPYFQGQRKSDMSLQRTNSSRDRLDFKEKGVQESGRSPEPAIQSTYYDYYGGEAGESGSAAGQNRLHQPQEIILVSFVLVFFCSGVYSRS
ncbi:LOW QUALITY PROTEIN: inactive serine protease 54 [Lemur catta]|uniref:LOW QUALITY PROTEIN: inactive serine protease 54 n=1 Tax=Lemur catta TaxID=9447 RepID=UPI001E2693FA|nr:LOW QUALITY PROTEIN: inactive serine protease 54 [Lemur catta]